MAATGPGCFAPSDRLTAIFRECSRDPTEVIRTRLRRLLNTFLQHHRNVAGNEGTNELAGRCCHQAGIWYYRILEKHAIGERKRLGIADISSILNNELYHYCLVACCLEMAISSNNLPCDFPLLLQIIRLAPYHFGKVIEPVLRVRDGLSRTVFRHLAQVEEKILESLAWTSDSPLWEDIRANDGRLPTCQQVMAPNSLEDPSRPVLQPDENLPGVPANHNQQPSAEDRPPIGTCLSVFSRKVYMLMSSRLKDISSKLGLSDELRLKIWTCFEHSVVHFTDIMADRHLDQLFMCAVYIIAKITCMELPFKRIIACYMSLPLASRNVYKDVLISGRNTENSPVGNNNPSVSALTPHTPSAHYPAPRQEDRGNLINFYNQVYVPKMKDLAMQFAPPPGVRTPPLTLLPQQYRASPRRYRLSSSHHIYISLYNREAAPQRAPGLTYTFNSDNSERLRHINNVVSGRIPSRRPHVASSMNGAEEVEGDDGPPIRRRRLDLPSAFHRRLRDVVNDRVAERDQGQPPAQEQM
nr:retinoblastoma-like protein 2 [Labrus bergylta]